MQRTIQLFLLAVLICSKVSAQVLFGSQWNGSSEISNSLNTTTKVFTNLNALNGIQSIVQGETAFDPISARYFNLTATHIKVIDVVSGLVIDSINNSIRMKGIEYNINTGHLIGSYWNGSNEIFVTLNLTTKIFSNGAILNGVQSIAQGETAFDAANNRYFNKTSDAINIIDATTGVIIDSVLNTPRMKGIEYNTNTGKLIGSHWTGSNEVFTTLDVTTKVFTTVGALTGIQGIVQGETCFDSSSNKYFNITNLGITVIDALTGNIMDTISNSKHMKGIELKYQIKKDTSNTGGLNVSPNPSIDEILVSSPVNSVESESPFYITDLSGSKVITGKLIGSSTNINISQLKPGFYMLYSEKMMTTRIIKQ